MAQAYIISGGGGGGASSDELTAVANDVLAGQTYVGNDTDDDIGVGTLALTGDAEAGDVITGKTFYNSDAHTQVTGSLKLTGNAAVGDVIKGQTFYSNNPKSIQTGTLALTGNAAVGDVIKGRTFYSNNPKSIQTGTLALSGNAAVGDVLATKTFYNNDLHTIRTGTMANKGAWGTTMPINGNITIPIGYHNGAGRITQSIPTFAGQTITPSGTQQVASTSGKYCTGNVTVNAIPSSYVQVGSTINFFDFGGVRFSNVYGDYGVSYERLTADRAYSDNTGYGPNRFHFNEDVYMSATSSRGTIVFMNVAIPINVRVRFTFTFNTVSGDWTGSQATTSGIMGINTNDASTWLSANNRSGSELTTNLQSELISSGATHYTYFVKLRYGGGGSASVTVHFVTVSATVL